MRCSYFLSLSLSVWDYLGWEVVLVTWEGFPVNPRGSGRRRAVIAGEAVVEDPRTSRISTAPPKPCLGLGVRGQWEVAGVAPLEFSCASVIFCLGASDGVLSSSLECN